MLLNLLIAMMATTYQNVTDQSNIEINFQRVAGSYELERQTFVFIILPKFLWFVIDQSNDASTIQCFCLGTYWSILDF